MALDSCKIWSETNFNCGLKRLPFLSSKQQAQNAQNSPLVPVFLFCHFQGRLANTLHYYHQHKPTKEWKSSGILSKVMKSMASCRITPSSWNISILLLMNSWLEHSSINLGLWTRVCHKDQNFGLFVCFGKQLLMTTLNVCSKTWKISDL